ncbi:MAG: hypothetical protein EOO75_04935, partial [Myxococcales bacterium]
MTMRSLLTGVVALSCVLTACAGDDVSPSDASGAQVKQGAEAGGQEPAAPDAPAPACTAGDARACLIEGDIVGQQSCGGEGAAAAWGE